jgi:DNA-binding response OmpR family regulator
VRVPRLLVVEARRRPVCSPRRRSATWSSTRSAGGVTVHGREVALRGEEFDLLARLTAEPGVAIRRETLMTDVGDAHRFGSTTTLDVHVAALRRRLVADVARLPRIVTLRGHGYRLEPPGPTG